MTRYYICLFLLCCLLITVPSRVHAEDFGSDREMSQFSSDSVRVLLIPHMETVLSGEISARIEAIAVDIGDNFIQGSLLVRFNCSVYEAELKKAKAMQKEAGKTLEVNKRLEGLGSISELEVAVAASRLDQAKADTIIKRHQVAGCFIRAPFSGSVVKRIAAPYQYITAGQPVLEIIDSNNLEVQIHIPSRWLRKIKHSTPFTVYVDEVEKQYSGVITALGSRIDPVSQTIEIRGKIDGENPELLAGMSGATQFDLK